MTLPGGYRLGKPAPARFSCRAKHFKTQGVERVRCAAQLALASLDQPGRPALVTSLAWGEGKETLVLLPAYQELFRPDRRSPETWGNLNSTAVAHVLDLVNFGCTLVTEGVVEFKQATLELLSPSWGWDTLCKPQFNETHGLAGGGQGGTTFPFIPLQLCPQLELLHPNTAGTVLKAPPAGADARRAEACTKLLRYIKWNLVCAGRLCKDATHELLLTVAGSCGGALLALSGVKSFEHARQRLREIAGQPQAPNTGGVECSTCKVALALLVYSQGGKSFCMSCRQAQAQCLRMYSPRIYRDLIRFIHSLEAAGIAPSPQRVLPPEEATFHPGTILEELEGLDLDTVAERLQEGGQGNKLRQGNWKALWDRAVTTLRVLRVAHKVKSLSIRGFSSEPLMKEAMIATFMNDFESTVESAVRGGQSGGAGGEGPSPATSAAGSTAGQRQGSPGPCGVPSSSGHAAGINGGSVAYEGQAIASNAAAQLPSPPPPLPQQQEQQQREEEASGGGEGPSATAAQESQGGQVSGQWAGSRKRGRPATDRRGGGATRVLYALLLTFTCSANLLINPEFGLGGHGGPSRLGDPRISAGLPERLSQYSAAGMDASTVLSWILGGQGSGTGVHRDYAPAYNVAFAVAASAFNTITGPIARWVFFRPGHLPEVDGVLAELGQQYTFAQGASIPPALLDALLADTRLEGLFHEVWQHAGERVFVPAGIPHLVLNLVPTIKVAWDVIEFRHLAQCITGLLPGGVQRSVEDYMSVAPNIMDFIYMAATGHAPFV